MTRSVVLTSLAPVDEDERPRCAHVLRMHGLDSHETQIWLCDMKPIWLVEVAVEADSIAACDMHLRNAAHQVIEWTLNEAR